MPLGGNLRAISFWDPVVERVNRRLAGWKKSYISLGGRITLIKAVLSNVPVYYMSLFKMPIKVSWELKKCQRDFLWEGGRGKKDHLVKWDNVCRPKEFGGLGIGHLNERNVAILGKWLWRFFNEVDSLWQSLIYNKYGMGPNGWDCSHRPSHSMSLIWRQVIKIYPLFLSHIRLVVDNGKTIKFWTDLWWEDTCLSIAQPRLFRVSLQVIFSKRRGDCKHFCPFSKW